MLRGMEVTGDGEMKTHVCVCVLEGEDRSKDNAAYTVIGIGICGYGRRYSIILYNLSDF